MKARKMWMNAVGDLVGPKGSYYTDPVLVIDARDFPEGYPEIGSEWLSACDYTQTLLVKGPPIFCIASDKWLVPVENDGSKVLFLIQIADLHPIPKTATGEVVSGFKVADGCTEKTIVVRLPEGEYDIIKRGDT